MSNEHVKCPICGTKNVADAENCKMCRTNLTKKDDGTIKVKTPKSRGKTITIVDIEDPLTRKKLEELTLIPGVTRKKALLLYQSGIHSMEEFLQKAFHGERFSENYSRTVANKLLVHSLKNKKKKTDILCPSCKAPNPPDSDNCKVCHFDIRGEMESINMAALSGKLSDSVTEILAKLDESEDFKALPVDMKAQLASIVESDDLDLDLKKPEEMEKMGIDLDSIDTETTPSNSGPEATPTSAENTDSVNSKAATQDPAIEKKPENKEHVNEQNETKEELPALFKTKLKEAMVEKSGKETLEQPIIAAQTAPEPMKPDPAEAPADSKADKIRRILTEKMDKWRRAGYETAGLEFCLEDVEAFKAKAKEVLAAGKTVKTKYKNQLEMWREKGFDVSELEPLLETDLDAFAEKAKDILKKQKKK